MRKRKIFHIWFLAALTLSLHCDAEAAFDAPPAEPLSFALANVVSFPDFLITFDDDLARWRLSTGGSRLFGMPEIQPFQICLRVPVLNGSVFLKGDGLRSGTYRETSAGAGYERSISNYLLTGAELSVLQVSIKEYGDAWSGQLNARMRWEPRQRLQLGFIWINVTGASIGADHYPLPRRIALGGMFTVMTSARLILELEQDSRHPLSTRFGIALCPTNRITLLLGLQSDPDIVSAGLSCLIQTIRASAAFQYHPDLGLSQCYGISVAF